LQKTSPPDGLAQAVSKNFGRAAEWLSSEFIEYNSSLKPLWNGTVHSYKLVGPAWPNLVYVFEMPDRNGKVRWRIYHHGPVRWPTALDAVKAAYRERWIGKFGLESSN